MSAKLPMGQGCVSVPNHTFSSSFGMLHPVISRKEAALLYLHSVCGFGQGGIHTNKTRVQVKQRKQQTRD